MRVLVAVCTLVVMAACSIRLLLSKVANLMTVRVRLSCLVLNLTCENPARCCNGTLRTHDVRILARLNIVTSCLWVVVALLSS